MKENGVLRKIRSGRTVFGPNVQLDSPLLVEMVGLAGFDWVMLDGEHGYVQPRLIELAIAADAAGITPIVRTGGSERGEIMRALESGAGGVQVPMVRDPKHARDIYEARRFVHTS